MAQYDSAGTKEESSMDLQSDAKSIAKQLDRGDADGAADRLRDQFSRMDSDTALAFASKVQANDQKNTGADLLITQVADDAIRVSVLNPLTDRQGYQMQGNDGRPLFEKQDVATISGYFQSNDDQVRGRGQSDDYYAGSDAPPVYRGNPDVPPYDPGYDQPPVYERAPRSGGLDAGSAIIGLGIGTVLGTVLSGGRRHHGGGQFNYGGPGYGYDHFPRQMPPTRGWSTYQQPQYPRSGCGVTYRCKR
jgi:hypothetical protein